MVRTAGTTITTPLNNFNLRVNPVRCEELFKPTCNCPDVPIQTDWCRVSACLPILRPYNFTISRRPPRTTSDCCYYCESSRRACVLWNMPPISSLGDNTAIQCYSRVNVNVRVWTIYCSINERIQVTQWEYLVTH